MNIFILPYTDIFILAYADIFILAYADIIILIIFIKYKVETWFLSTYVVAER